MITTWKLPRSYEVKICCYQVPANAYFSIHWDGIDQIFIIVNCYLGKMVKSYQNQAEIYPVYFRDLKIALAFAADKYSY